MAGSEELLFAESSAREMLPEISWMFDSRLLFGSTAGSPIFVGE